MTLEELVSDAAEWFDGNYQNEPRRLLTVDTAVRLIREAIAERDNRWQRAVGNDLEGVEELARSECQ